MPFTDLPTGDTILFRSGPGLSYPVKDIAFLAYSTRFFLLLEVCFIKRGYVVERGVVLTAQDVAQMLF